MKNRFQDRTGPIRTGPDQSGLLKVTTNPVLVFDFVRNRKTGPGPVQTGLSLGPGIAPWNPHFGVHHQIYLEFL
jgi:hypothetical protein